MISHGATELAVVIEYDHEHINHVWSDVRMGLHTREEAQNLEDGTWSAYGVTVARICECCDQITEPYVSALWGCVVESSNQDGRYAVDNLDAITDDYLREVARDVLREAREQS